MKVQYQLSIYQVGNALDITCLSLWVPRPNLLFTTIYFYTTLQYWPKLSSSKSNYALSHLIQASHIIRILQKTVQSLKEERKNLPKY